MFGDLIAEVVVPDLQADVHVDLVSGDVGGRGPEGGAGWHPDQQHPGVIGGVHCVRDLAGVVVLVGDSRQLEQDVSVVGALHEPLASLPLDLGQLADEGPDLLQQALCWRCPESCYTQERSETVQSSGKERLNSGIIPTPSPHFSFLLVSVLNFISLMANVTA